MQHHVDTSVQTDVHDGYVCSMSVLITFPEQRISCRSPQQTPAKGGSRSENFSLTFLLRCITAGDDYHTRSRGGGGGSRGSYEPPFEN